MSANQDDLTTLQAAILTAGIIHQLRETNVALQAQVERLEQEFARRTENAMYWSKRTEALRQERDAAIADLAEARRQGRERGELLADAYDCIGECVPVLGWSGVVSQTGNRDWEGLEFRMSAALSVEAPVLSASSEQDELIFPQPERHDYGVVWKGKTKEDLARLLAMAKAAQEWAQSWTPYQMEDGINPADKALLDAVAVLEVQP